MPRKKSRKKSRKSCPKGKIRRQSYVKKSHNRRSYVKKDGTRVKGSYVDKTKVKSGCTKDRGMPGKTPKIKRILPKPGEEVSFRKFGYKVNNSDIVRERALSRVVKLFGPLKSLRRLNLLRNYQPRDKEGRRVSRIMSRDVEYLKKKYKNYKRRHGRTLSSKKNSTKRKRRKKRKSSKKRRKSSKKKRKSSKKKRKSSKNRRKSSKKKRKSSKKMRKSRKRRKSSKKRRKSSKKRIKR